MASAEDAGAVQLPAPLGPSDPEAAELVLGLCYSELHQLASHLMECQPAGHILQAEALVHEAYLRLVGAQDPRWRSHRHLLSAAAKAMHWVLVDHARRGSNRVAVVSDSRALERVLVTYENPALVLLALEQALGDLARADPEMARVVELRFFGGLPMEEVAEILDMPLRVLQRRWAAVRARLYSQLS